MIVVRVGEVSEEIKACIGRHYTAADVTEFASVRDLQKSDGYPENVRVIILSSILTFDVKSIRSIRRKNPQLFVCVWSPAACRDPTLRWTLFSKGLVNMVTEDLHALDTVLTSHKFIQNHPGPLSCPSCGANQLSEDALWMHDPLYHENDENLTRITCPLCSKLVRKPWAIHLHYEHGPVGRGEVECPDANHSHPELYAFALVVCKHPETGKYLAVQEFCGKGYWLPGGAVDAGEDIKIAAIRETKEEAGIDVTLKGILRMELTPKPRYVRMRVIFYAEPVDISQKPKSVPDWESVGASWMSVEEIGSLPLRGSEPKKWAQYVEAGGPIYPLSLLTKEGAPVTL